MLRRTVLVLVVSMALDSLASAPSRRGDQVKALDLDGDGIEPDSIGMESPRGW